MDAYSLRPRCNSHLQGMLSRTVRCIEAGIRPMCVRRGARSCAPWGLPAATRAPRRVPALNPLTAGVPTQLRV